MKKNKILKELSIVFILTTILTMMILKINYMKFSMPPAYTGDGLFLSYNVKNIQDFGWWFKNPNVGAPFGGELYDFPFYFDSLFLFIFKIILIPIKDWGKAINIFFIGIFPLTSMISYYVMRKFKINFLISILGSLCFTFLPYRFFRGAGHFYLSCYFLIPLMVLFLYKFYIDEEDFSIKKFIKNRKNLYSMLILSLIPISGIYYAFFFCFFLMIVFISKINLKNKRTLNNLYKLLCCYGIMFFIGFLIYIPGLIYKISVEKNLEAPIRFAKESDMYSLTISRLFISPKYMDIPVFEKIKLSLQDYLQYLPRGEGTGVEYLGIIGIIGVLYLLLMLFNKNKIKDKKIILLKNLNISSILLGTASGFGLIFSILVSAQIRAYARISVFIAYFSILAVCLLLNELNKNLKNNLHKKIFSILVVVLFSLAILEQIPDNLNYEGAKITHLKEFQSDRKFINSIEKMLGNDGMVFQFPYHKFPEGGLGPQDYQLFKGYLHSKKVKWSFGGYRGRKSDNWNEMVTSLPMEQLLKKIILVGFNGIYIDRSMYKNKEYVIIENEIENITKAKPYVSDDNKLVFFNLIDYSNTIKSKYSKEQLLNEKDKNLVIIMEKGIYELETENNRRWRWTEKEFEFIILNEKENGKFTLETDIFSEYPENSELIIEYNGKKQKVIVNNRGVKLKESFKLSRGKNIIKLSTNTKKVNAPKDKRKLYLRFENIETNIE